MGRASRAEGQGGGFHQQQWLPGKHNVHMIWRVKFPLQHGCSTVWFRALTCGAEQTSAAVKLSRCCLLPVCCCNEGSLEFSALVSSKHQPRNRQTAVTNVCLGSFQPLALHELVLCWPLSTPPPHTVVMHHGKPMPCRAVSCHVLLMHRVIWTQERLQQLRQLPDKRGILISAGKVHHVGNAAIILHVSMPPGCQAVEKGGKSMHALAWPPMH